MLLKSMVNADFKSKHITSHYYLLYSIFADKSIAYQHKAKYYPIITLSHHLKCKIGRAILC